VKSDLPPGGLLPLHHEAAVEPVNSHQLVMGALLNDLTVIDNKNLVGMAHTAALHVPEPRHEIAQRGLAAAGGADDGNRRFLRDGQGHIVQNGLAVIGEIHMGQGDVLPFRRQILPINIHGLHTQDGICLVHADVDGAEQSRKASGRIQLFKENEGADEHQKAIRQLHCAAEVEYDGSGADGNAGELVDNELRQHIKNRRDLHGKGCLPSFLHSAVYLRGRVVGQVKILDLGNALHIFQYLGDKPLAGVELPLGKGLLRPLHGGVDGEEQQQSRQRNKPHTPVKEEHHDRDDAGGQKAAGRDHYHAGSHIRHVLHGVGGDGGHLAQAVVIEPAHRQIPQMLRNLNPLVGAGAVACTGLEHGGLHVDGDGHNQRSDDDSKARPECRHGDILKTRIDNPEENWVIFKDVHEPIVDRDTFEQVQKKVIKRTKRRAPKSENGEKSIFSDLLYCADCGHKLWYHVNTINKNICFFSCSNYVKDYRGSCPTRHYVRADAIEQVVKLELQRMAQFLRDDEPMFADLLERKSNREIAEEKKHLEGELQKARMRTETVSRLYKKAFEKNAEGLLSDEGFLQITHEYDVEQLALKAKIPQLREQIAEAERQAANKDKFIAAIRKFMQMDELTAPLLRELIDHIEVYETQGVGKSRTQRIAIHYRFVGYIDIPAAPLTSHYISETRQGVAVEYIPA